MRWGAIRLRYPKSKARFMPPGSLGTGFCWSAIRRVCSANWTHILRPESLPIEVLHAPDRITMDDHAAKAARSKRESSMHVCARLVADGQGRRLHLGRQYRRLHGNRENGAGQTARRGSSRAHRRFSYPERFARGGDRRGRQCRLRAADAGSFRPDGRGLLAARAQGASARAWVCFRSAKKSTKATR